jgi:transcriptional regulator
LLVYLPRHFEEKDIGVLHALQRSHPLGAWVAQTDAGLEVNHLPFLLDATRGEHGTLVGHVARANPIWRSLSGGRGSVVVFQGPEAYISPSWYPSKAAHGKVVPTWNYAVVHAHGVPRAIEDRDWLLGLVTRLTETHEAARAAPWHVSDAPADYVETLLKAIVGIEIPIVRLDGKWKTSQNRAAEDKLGTIAGLNEVGHDAMARLVERHATGGDKR